MKTDIFGTWFQNYAFPSAKNKKKGTEYKIKLPYSNRKTENRKGKDTDFVTGFLAEKRIRKEKLWRIGNLLTSDHNDRCFLTAWDRRRCYAKKKGSS